VHRSASEEAEGLKGQDPAAIKGGQDPGAATEEGGKQRGKAPFTDSER
jgi:hypothetical protein